MKARASQWVMASDFNDLALVLLSCLGGIGIGYTGLGFQKHVTASTFLAVSTGVRAVIVILDIVGMGTRANTLAVFGLITVIAGSVWCASEDHGKQAEAANSAPEVAQNCQEA